MKHFLLCTTTAIALVGVTANAFADNGNYSNLTLSQSATNILQISQTGTKSQVTGFNWATDSVFKVKQAGDNNYTNINSSQYTVTHSTIISSTDGDNNDIQIKLHGLNAKAPYDKANNDYVNVNVKGGSTIFQATLKGSNDTINTTIVGLANYTDASLTGDNSSNTISISGNHNAVGNIDNSTFINPSLKANNTKKTTTVSGDENGIGSTNLYDNSTSNVTVRGYDNHVDNNLVGANNQLTISQVGKNANFSVNENRHAYSDIPAFVNNSKVALNSSGDNNNIQVAVYSPQGPANNLNINETVTGYNNQVKTSIEQAQNISVTERITGNGNSSNVTLKGSALNAYLIQSGNNNSYKASLTGTNIALVGSQFGSNNKADMTVAGNSINIKSNQNGTGNDVLLKANANNLNLTNIQYGTNNKTLLDVSGAGSTMYVYQDGTNNVTSIASSRPNDVVNVNQTGNNKNYTVVRK